MNKIVILLAVSINLSFSFKPSTKVDQIKTPLKIVVNGAEKGKTINLGVFRKTDNFPEQGKYFKNYKQITESKGSIVFVIDNLPYSTYSLAVFQDNNLDGILNTNFFGIPKEPYGFSQNFKPKLSAPDFEDCSITYNNEQNTYVINLQK
jgi:uncharacterized protein (DUF2141 family)